MTVWLIWYEYDVNEDPSVVSIHSTQKSAEAKISELILDNWQAKNLWMEEWDVD